MSYVRRDIADGNIKNGPKVSIQSGVYRCERDCGITPKMEISVVKEGYHPPHYGMCAYIVYVEFVEWIESCNHVRCPTTISSPFSSFHSHMLPLSISLTLTLYILDIYIFRSVSLAADFGAITAAEAKMFIVCIRVCVNQETNVNV